MTANKLVGLVFEAWNDLDRVLNNLDAVQATDQVDGQSSFAWTFAHVTQQVDSWINVNFQGRASHPFLSSDQFRLGSSGAADNWTAIELAVRDVRVAARHYLERQTENDLNKTIPYLGSIIILRQHGLNLRYALMRIVAHHYFHIGVIACQRDRLGHQVGDYPGLMAECLLLAL